MPFKSKAQQRKCYALKAQGKAGTWNCNEWSEETDFKKLPKKVKKGKIMESAKFVNFLNDIKTPKNELIVESIQQAFKVCFESIIYEAEGEDAKNPDLPDNTEDGSVSKAEQTKPEVNLDLPGDEDEPGKAYDGNDKDTPTGNSSSNGGTGASAMNEDVSSDADLADKELVVDAEKKDVAEQTDKVREAEKALAAEKVVAAEKKLADEKKNLDMQSKI